MKVLIGSFTLFLCVCLQGQLRAAQFGNFDYVDNHLSEYGEVNQSHHDNIDDEKHEHTHKHSENGEEHEHRHGHKKPSPQETQFFSSGEGIRPSLLASISKSGFREICLFSNSYPDELFRPPIA